MSWIFKQSPAPSLTLSPDHHQRNVRVKEDFSAIGETIGRQLRGVATFLAPPPSNEAEANSERAGGAPPSKALVGIKNDLAEIGGSLKSGLSKFTSSLMQCQGTVKEDDDGEVEDYVPGLSDEAIHFIDELSSRQEFWTDFPLPLQNDFRLSEEQQEHVATIIELVPAIATLKDSLQSFMTSNQFWLIYFILLLPRLNDEDMELLSTPQIEKTRDLLLQKINNKNIDKQEYPSTSGASVDEITEIVGACEGLELQEQDTTEQLLEDTDADTSTSGNDRKKFEIVEEASFSDLEAYDSDLSHRLSGANRSHIPRNVSSAGSTDWIQLHPETGLNKTRQSYSDVESAEWLNVDEFE